jgi:methionine sulfoxide reductase heme-binding subunit
MATWQTRYTRPVLYIAGFAAMAGVGVAAAMENAGMRLVVARQLFGLWALGLVFASMLIGPLTAVLPWLPIKPALLHGRRVVGILAACFAAAHVTCYLWSVLARDWHELYRPGVLWVIGLALGLIALTDLAILALTSRDSAVRKMGGQRWKRLHATVYTAMFVILIHAVCVGADFGVSRAPDVQGEGDVGCLIGFACLAAGWVVFFLLRRVGKKWTPGFMRPEEPAKMSS